MKKTTISIVLIIGIVLFINLVSEQYYFRLDFTEDKEYTLSKATKNILEDLEDPVTVKAYFSEGLSPQIEKALKRFKEYLIEYGRISDGNVVYSFVNPSEDEDLEKEAMEAGIQPILINVREENEIKQQKAYLGVVFEYGDQKEIIPVVEPNIALEYAMTSAIKKVSASEKPAVGIIQGHGEPSLMDLAQVNQGLSVLYDVEPFYLNDTTPVPNHIKTIMLVRPTDSISEGSLRMLDAFLENGGNLFVAMNRLEANLQNQYASVKNIGLETWLQRKGITVNEDLAVDAKCGVVTVGQGNSFFAPRINFPYLPIIQTFADHPITNGIEAVLLQFASTISFQSNDTTARFTPLAFTSETSGSMKAPVYMNVQKNWTKNDLPLSKQIVAGVLERSYGNGSSSKLFIIGDGDFPVGNPNSRQQVDANSVNLAVNAVDYLSDDTGLIDLRTKGINYRPIDELEDATKTTLKYLNFLLPILLVVIYGIVRMQMNRMRRIKRMELDYSK